MKKLAMVLMVVCLGAAGTASADRFDIQDLLDWGFMGPNGVVGIYAVDPVDLGGSYEYVVDLYVRSGCGSGGGYKILGFDPATALNVDVSGVICAPTDVWYGDAWNANNLWHVQADYAPINYGAECFQHAYPRGTSDGFDVPQEGWAFSHGEGILWTVRIVLPAFYPEGTMFAACDYGPDDLVVLWPSTVPEPATMSLLGLGGLAALIRRRR